MKKNWLAVLIACCVAISASSQTLFTYGPYKVDAAEFLRAFNKNNQSASGDKEKAIREYLDLYINSRLKIQEAYNRRYDTLPKVQSEISNLRSQIIDTYMSDPQAIERLTGEAFRRSLKDIHLAHIFIAANSFGDTIVPRKKLDEVLARLGKGENFLSVAQQLSDDPAARDNNGDLNYITVFTLPYELENIAYTTAPGSYSPPYRSKAGYHIFKNLGERKALGKIKIRQILLAFPPGAGEAGKKQVAALADSLYRRIQAGDDFGKLATAFSTDYISAASNGLLPDVAVGQFEPAFEKTIWALPADNAVSRPFLTSYGYHIVKRVALKPVVTNPADKTNQDELKQKVQADDRWKTARDFIYARMRSKGDFRQIPYNETELWKLSDSLLDHKLVGGVQGLDAQSALYTIGNATLKVSDWINYAQANRYVPGQSTLRTYSSIMDEYVKTNMYQYYYNHLEDFNDEFHNQMNEFREGNLFFEIMEQEVWNKAQNDEAALLALYEKDKTRYDWKPSAEAAVFFCTDEATAKTLSARLKKNPADWRTITASLEEKATADSSRYEWAQIPGLGNATPHPGMITAPTVNKVDNTVSFAWIFRVTPGPLPRSFDDAKGLVMNDYQAILEEAWVNELKKKYPVVIDQKVLAQIVK